MVGVGVQLEGSLKPEHSRLECQPMWRVFVRLEVLPGLAPSGGCSPVLAGWVIEGWSRKEGPVLFFRK